jgi:hypothetical protein
VALLPGTSGRKAEPPGLSGIERAMVILVEMLRKIIAAAAMLAAVLLSACGTGTRAPEGGSVQQLKTGVSSSGYPAGEPKDAGSPALASSTESHYSRDQTEKK